MNVKSFVLAVLFFFASVVIAATVGRLTGEPFFSFMLGMLGGSMSPIVYVLAEEWLS